MKVEEEIVAMVNYNHHNPGKEVVMVIDETNGDWWFERNHEKLDLIAEKLVLDYGDDDVLRFI